MNLNCLHNFYDQDNISVLTNLQIKFSLFKEKKMQTVRNSYFTIKFVPIAMTSD